MNQKVKALPRRKSPEGLPIDAREWLREDWQDLYVAMETIKARIAARHRQGAAEKPV